MRLKRKLRTIVIQILNKKERIFLWKSWKKKSILWFSIQSKLFIGLHSISGNPVKIVKKWLEVGMFIDKVTIVISMFLLEMAGDLMTNGLNQPPPRVF